MQYDQKSIVLIIIIATVIILLNIILLMIILYKYQKKNIIDLKDKILKKSKYDNNVLDSQIELQEQTFRRISQEIHDNIGLTLSLAKLNLTKIDSLKFPIVHETSSYSEELITIALDELRMISSNLNPDVIKKIGLHTALQEEIKKINRINLIKVHQESTGTPFFLDPHSELLIFRIIQELLNNIIKHAKATDAWVVTHYYENWIYLTIKDNGSGFEIVENTKRHSSGLINIESRCKLLNGHFERHSNTEGTIITL